MKKLSNFLNQNILLSLGPKIDKFWFVSFFNVVTIGLIFNTLLSCTDTEQEKFANKSLKIDDPFQYENTLKELTMFFGEVMREESALKELYSFASTGGSPADINFKLKSLFEEDKNNPNFKKYSFIASAFKNKSKNLRSAENAISGEDLIQFIIDNDITVLAPYLIEDFKIEELEELTISWWTEEFEMQNTRRDKDWKGATKAIKFSLNKKLAVENDAKSFKNEEYFLADDEWAIENPTIVLGAFKSNEFNQNDVKTLSHKAITQNGRIGNSPVNLCNSSNKSIQTIAVNMPALRLENNIRSWPNPNEIFCWVVTIDSFTPNSNGSPILTPLIQVPLTRFVVTRKEANIKRWLPLNALAIPAWKPFSDDMVMVWACTKTDDSIHQNVSVSASQEGNSATLITNVIKNSVELVAVQLYPKCTTISSNVNAINQGYGFYGNTNYPIRAFGAVRTYFTLDAY
jgi:hypothetical protein